MSPQLLEWAYTQGIFPMSLPDGSVGWFMPKRRAIIPIGSFRVSRSLRKSAKKFQVLFDTSYESVMHKCARPDTWISQDFVKVYSQLFALGHGHSAEAYQDGQLVGGVYGVCFGGAFMAESMFHTKTDAGKVALWKLMEKLGSASYQLVDVQYLTPHLASLGAIEVSDKQYLLRLAKALKVSPDW